jgi:aldose 1-epimerase
MSVTTVPLSGRQYEIRNGGYFAVIASVGASLRVLEHEGRNLVVPFEADQLRPAYRGATLAPWPNRVVDGRYVFAGVGHQLPLSEPARAHALHGLMAWAGWEAVEWEADRVTLAAVIEPQDGYPWRVRVQTTYVLDSNGLTQTVVAVNESGSVAPFGTGPHPYLVAGSGLVDEWTLLFRADAVLLVTPDRLAPVGVANVDTDPARFDFRDPKSLAGVDLDHAFTGLARDASRLAEVRLTAPDGSGVRMSWGDSCPWVQIHTADQPGGNADVRHRIGLAVEPMTCAPDAFNGFPGVDSGLLVLEPGGSVSASWCISAIE